MVQDIARRLSGRGEAEMIAQGVIAAVMLWCLGLPFVLKSKNKVAIIVYFWIPIAFEMFCGRG